LVVTLWLIHNYLVRHEIAIDFHHDFWVAGSRVLHGSGPYGWTRAQIASLVAFPYPAPAALLLAPFALLPHAVADGVFVALCMLALVATLRVLGVRDRRLYGLVFLWWPVVNAWQTANVTLLFGLGIAIIWRSREQPLKAGLLTALLICVKPFAWPVGVWLLATRRNAAAGYALVSTLILSASAWAILGFDQVARWVRLIGDMTDVLYRQGYGLVAFAAHLGFGRGAATALYVALTAATTVGCLILARRGLEKAAFAVAVALMIAGSPLVDNHYFALLIVPLAIIRPRLGVAWLVPLALWVCPATGVATWQVTLAWAVTIAVVGGLVRSASPRGERAATSKGAVIDAVQVAGGVA
jgi:hypothetical protein